MKSNNTYFNLLASFAYLHKSKDFTESLFGAHENGIANVMIDSGAFTLFNAKQNRDWLTVDSYCDFLEKYQYKCEKYVMLDVIGDDDASKANYELMLKRDFNPMFVYTMADNDITYLKHAVENNPHVCVAGGVTSKGDWIKQRFQQVYKETNGLIHGLGYVTYPNMYQLPLHSVDSSSWLQSGLVYGTIPYFDNGMKGIAYKDILKRKKKMPIQLIRQFEKHNISPKMFSDLENHKGNRSIAFMMSILAFIEYQKVSNRAGVRLFLAVASYDQMRALLYVQEHLESENLTYQNFQKS